jgi:uncharacterized protein YndB with AHSA1/START domain
MIDIVYQLNAIDREVSRQPGDDGEMVTVVLRREYPAAIEDVWSALTEPDRIKRWFMPISGDLEVGGKFQLEGNAGGDILGCEPPSRFKVTFGGPDSVVEVHLTQAEPGTGAERTTLQLTHTVPIAMAGSGAGALFVGPGWDGALMGLGLYVVGEAPGDPVAAAGSPEVLAFSKQSVQAWVDTVERSGTATAGEVAQAREVSLAQFVGTSPGK